MNTISSLSAAAQSNQTNSTQTHGAHRRGSHFIMTEGNTSGDAQGNAGAVQSFASILEGVTKVAAKVAKTALG